LKAIVCFLRGELKNCPCPMRPLPAKEENRTG
jgi:hypothetical protein